MSLFGAVSAAPGTIVSMPASAARDDPVLVSHTGVPLTRATTFRFTLDPTRDQHRQLLAHAGAARLAFNHHIARAKANLDPRAAEKSYGVAAADPRSGFCVVRATHPPTLAGEHMGPGARRIKVCCRTSPGRDSRARPFRLFRIGCS